MTGPRRITFVTSPARCNLRCSVCRDHSPLRERAPDDRELPLALVSRVVEEARERGLSEVIPSTRGEPLLWPGLTALAELCESRGVLLNVTTNGTFPRLGAQGWARRLASAAADVKISWNGARRETAEELMEGLCFDAALDGVRALVAARDARRARGERATRVSFQVTARERNVEEIPAIVALAADLGVDRVKVNQLQVHFPALAGEELRRSAGSRARWNAAVRAAHEAAERHRSSGGTIELENLVEMAFAADDARGGAPGRARSCPFLGREAWILQDGSFAPCPAPAALDGRMGRFGSVAETSLGDIWEGEAYRELVATHESRSDCAACPLRRPGGL
jgi:MoaA/NifB/PqqE/SkfB family radical SAM enzyme